MPAHGRAARYPPRIPWVLLIVMTLAPGAGLSAQAPSDWFPAAAKEGLARDLAPRLDHIAIGIEQAELLATSRRVVLEMGLRIDTLGADKLMSLAPRFAKLEVPLQGQKHLDAMARLGMCTYYLEARYANLEGLDADARMDAAMGPMSLALSTIYLRHHYLKEGGTDEAIKAYLAGDPLNVVAFAVQRDKALLDYTATECRAVVSALLD